MVLIVILQIFVVAFTALFIFVKYKQSFWRRKGVRQIEPKFVIGNVSFSESFGNQFRKIYEKFKSEGTKHGGIYSFLNPVYMPMELDVIKSILIKDFHHFMDRGFINVDEKTDPLSGHLFHLEGEKWKNLRTKLTPTFTSGKLKMMFQTFLDCTKGLEEMVQQYSDEAEPVEIKEILARFTTDIIGNCAFGLECNTMKNADSEFRKYMKAIFDSSTSTQLRLLATQVLPQKILSLFTIKLIRDDVEEFFINVVKDTVEFREKNNIFRKDFMHSMLQLKNIGTVTDDDKITDEYGTKRFLFTLNEISAQCFVFFFAGYETSSTTMNFAFYELSRNQNVQERLRKEINEVLSKYNNEFTYDSVAEMKYLDQVIRETLRKYPPASELGRKCTIPYKIPGTDIVLDKGVRIRISVWGIHMDPEYYPEPEKFDPERFSKENEERRPACTWLPFGDGPRQCIGTRFGMLQSKIGVASIIRKFKVTLNGKTQEPLVMDPIGFITTPLGGIWININKI